MDLLLNHIGDLAQWVLIWLLLYRTRAERAERERDEARREWVARISAVEAERDEAREKASRDRVARSQAILAERALAGGVMGTPVYLTFHEYDPREHVEEQRSLCLWSDGVMYWTGWWSRDNQTLYIAKPDGTNERMDDSQIRWWAKLPNLFMVIGTAYPAATEIMNRILRKEDIPDE